MKKIIFSVAMVFAMALMFFLPPAFAGDHPGNGHDNNGHSAEHGNKGKNDSGNTHGKSGSDPDGNSNGGADKPGGSGGTSTPKDGNNGSGNDADCEDDNNGKGVPGHCKSGHGSHPTPTPPVTQPTPPAPTHSGGPHPTKVTICHATGSVKNPYVEITISNNAVNAHRHHQNGHDIIPAPAGGCPGAVVPPVVVPTTPVPTHPVTTPPVSTPTSHPTPVVPTEIVTPLPTPETSTPSANVTPQATPQDHAAPVNGVLPNTGAPAHVIIWAIVALIIIALGFYLIRRRP